MAEPVQKYSDEKFYRSLLSAYEASYGKIPESAPPGNGKPEDEKLVLQRKLVTAFSDMEKHGGFMDPNVAIKLLGNFPKDDIQGMGFLTSATVAAIAEKATDPTGISQILGKYKELTGRLLPPEMSSANYDRSMIGLFKHDHTLLQSYLSSFPIDALSDKKLIEERAPGFKLNIPTEEAIRHIDENPKKFWGFGILDIQDRKVVNHLLETGTAQPGILTSTFIINNAERLKRDSLDVDRYVGRAVSVSSPRDNYTSFAKANPETRDIIKPHLIKDAEVRPLSTLQHISDRIEADHKTYKPFLDALKPHLLDDYTKTQNAAPIAIGLNALHNLGKAERFSLVDGFKSGDIYDVLTKASNIHYTSTFNGLFDIMQQRMKAENKTLSDIVGDNPDRTDRLATLVESATTFNRTRDLLKSLNDQDKIALIDAIIPKTITSQEGSSYNIAAISGLTAALGKDNPLLKYVEGRIIENFTNGTPEQKIDMALIASWYQKSSGQQPSAENAAFFQKIANDPKYDLPDMRRLPVKDLIDEKGRNFQMHIFYDDEDGHMSYKSFRDSLKKNGWAEDHQENFTVFRKSQNGRSIELYASRPESDGSGASAAESSIADKNGKISVLVHRGHSYHVDKSLYFVQPDNKLVFLGSCGGKQNVSSVLAASPDAQVLSTAGVGRMVINNQSFLEISSQILGSREINWQGMKEGWQRSAAGNRALAEDYNNYVVPHENLNLMFERKHQQLLNEQPQSGPQSNLNRQFENSTMGAVQQELAAAEIERKGPAVNDPAFNPSLRA